MVKGEPCYSWRGLFLPIIQAHQGFTLKKAFQAISVNIPSNSISLHNGCFLQHPLIPLFRFGNKERIKFVF
jgi:hypothetical protein